MNKKGVTLLEILISVGLIATVLVFLFNLLLNIQYEEKYAPYAKKNQVNRITIIKTIENDFLTKGLDLTRIAHSFNSNHTLVIPLKDGTSKLLQVEEGYIKYDSDKWLINKDNDYTKYDVANLSLTLSSKDLCTPLLNIDSNYDDICDINCDINNDGKLDYRDRYVDLTYKSCTKYQYLRIKIPVLTSDEKNNSLDDLELFYMDRI